MPTFKIVFVNPADTSDSKTYFMEGKEIEDAARKARDSFFFHAPLRSATWVMQSIERRSPITAVTVLPAQDVARA